MIFKKLVSMLATVPLAFSPLSLTASADDLSAELDRDIFKYAVLQGQNYSSWERTVDGTRQYLNILTDAREANLTAPYSYDPIFGFSFNPIVDYYNRLYGNDVEYAGFAVCALTIPQQYQFYTDRIVIVASTPYEEIDPDYALTGTYMSFLTNAGYYQVPYDPITHTFVAEFNGQEKVTLFSMPTYGFQSNNEFYGYNIPIPRTKLVAQLYFFQQNVTLARRAYNDGYAKGLEHGNRESYQNGYADGQRSANIMHTFISSIFEAPINAVYTALDVEVMGANLGDVIRGVITTACVIGVIAFIVKLKLL